MKKMIVIGLIFLIVVVIIFVNYKDSFSNKICFEENCFDVEIADNNEERSRGLMFQEELCRDCGMLFVYDEPVNSKFWMKNTLIPLDIIWMDESFVVQYIAEAVPCVIEECELYGPSSEVKSNYVLEVNSGVVEEIGLEVGEKMRFN